MKKITKKNDSNPVCKGVIWLPVNSSLLQRMYFSEVIVNVNVIVHVVAERASLHLARPKIKLFYSLKMQCA